MAESSKRVIVDGVEFERVWLFPRIIGAMTAAMQPGRLIIALFMVILLIALGRMWDKYTEPNVHPGGLLMGRYDFPDIARHQAQLMMTLSQRAPARLQPMSAQDVTFDAAQVQEWIRETYVIERGKATDPDARDAIDAAYLAARKQIDATRPRGDFEATIDHIIVSFRMMLDGVIALSPASVLVGADHLFIQTPSALWKHQTWFLIIYGLAFVVTFAIGGGAISRMAAMHQAHGQRLSINEATDFAISRAGGLVWAQLLPLLLLGLLGVVVMLIGFVMRAPVLDIILALFYGLILVLGFLMAFILVGYVVGFPLLVPSIACENGDGADAMQRAYAYIVNRPLHALWCWAVGLFGLAIGFAIVAALALVTLNVAGAMFATLAPNTAAVVAGGYQPGALTNGGADALAGGLWAGGSWHQRWSGNIILAWQSLVVCLVVAYVVSYHFSASTIAYLLMRKASDGQEPDEIWRPGLIPGTLAPLPPKIESSVKDMNQEP